jgi:predicted unusual protein kinase regulating ubiquinone biosynthesis (AarF/ABC1/UbiB family)
MNRLVKDMYTRCTILACSCMVVVQTAVVVSWFGRSWLLETKEGGVYLSKSLRVLGVMGIKLGQYLSQRPDLFGDECRRELMTLTDSNTRVSWNELRDRFPPSVTQETCPIGVGSVAQVYVIQWKGKPAVMKVLLPGDDAVLIQFQMCRIFLEAFEYIGILPVKWKEFIDNTVNQFDLRKEADEMIYAYNLFGCSLGIATDDGTKIRVPQLLWKSKYAIVMELAPGVALHSVSAVSRPIADKARVYALHYMTNSGDHRFHADLHDGNEFFDDLSNTLLLIDFGLCAHPPVEWKSPIHSILRYSKDPTNIVAATEMMCSVFDISSEHARRLLPDFMAMFGTTPTSSIRESTGAFFAFTRKVNILIAPHTISYFMQLIATE